MASTPSIFNRNEATRPSAEEFRAKFGVSEEYLVTLRVTGDDTIGENGFFEVSTSLDETFSLGMGSSWGAPFANVISDAAGKLQEGAGGRGGAVIGAARLAAQGMGIQERSRPTSAQVWESSDPIGFSFPFTFVALTDPKKEVADKVRNLLKLTAPSEFGSVLRAPGPTIVGSVLSETFGTEGRYISLHIGRFLKLYNCIVERVDAQFDSMFGPDGIPLKAKVTVDIKSYFTCFTTKDIDHLFNQTER